MSQRDSHLMELGSFDRVMDMTTYMGEEADYFLRTIIKYMKEDLKATRPVDVALALTIAPVGDAAFRMLADPEMDIYVEKAKKQWIELANVILQTPALSETKNASLRRLLEDRIRRLHHRHRNPNKRRLLR